MNKNILLSFAIILIYCTVANSYAIHHVPESDVIDHGQQQGGFHKRSIPLSLNGDLRTLARMLYTQQRRRRVDNFAVIRQRLFDLGKRSGGTTHTGSSIGDEEEDNRIPYSVVQARHEKSLLVGDQNGGMGSDIDQVKYQKKAQRLSINGALSTLSDMLAANGRRRFQEERALNQQKLMNLGK